LGDSTAKKSILDDLINGVTQNPTVPAPLLPALSGGDTSDSSWHPPLLPPGTPSPASAAPAAAPKGPTLGTQEQLEAPAKDAIPGPTDGGSWSADRSTLTLPAQSKENSDQPVTSDDQPSFLRKLGRIAGGAVGFSNPNSSPQASLGAKIGQMVGRAGASLALAAGTPEQKQLAEEQLQMPLKTAQIANEMQYRNGMLGLKDQANQNAANKTDLQYGPNGTARETADAAAQNAQSNELLRAAHTKQIEASLNGQVHVMPQIAKMIGREDLADQNISPIRYQQEVGNVLKSLGAKTVDLGDDGVWGASPLTGKISRLGDSPSVARSNSMLLRTQLPVNDGQGNTLGWVNPQTNSYTPVTAINAKGGGTPLSSALGGDVIPPKPTSSVLSRGQVAQTILPQIPVIKNEVAQLADEIGPAAGRWTDFWVNKGGANDPRFAGLNQDLQLYATAIGLAHFGASMPQTFVQDMMHDFGTAQSPEDLQARIDHAEGWVQDYASRVGGGNPPAQKPNNGTPQKPNNGAPSNDVVEYVRGSDGKLHPKGQ
jgi:hypothetical protein